ncbi:phosphoadenylyl-sulfate reductase [Magnetococcus sp. PR-3]|uniref:phosphoadenylyl-sulfate reductase n=1 Tax=Magnetococcus sp. PR-3 TaxID=3120355 RepID=UPI002FCDE581
MNSYDPEEDVQRSIELEDRYGHLPAEHLIRLALLELFPGQIAVTSSFGIEAAVLLHMVSRVDPTVPVVFVDTGRHFPETLGYVDQLSSHLQLSHVQRVQPDAQALAQQDPEGQLALSDADRCCYLRKVAPIQPVMGRYSAWITGRKRCHGGTRELLPALEVVGGQVKFNPLAGWCRAELNSWYERHQLPRHPLEAKGYGSVGCAPCTHPANVEGDPRAGRWAGQEKKECGIHVATPQISNPAAQPLPVLNGLGLKLSKPNPQG